LPPSVALLRGGRYLGRVFAMLRVESRQGGDRLLAGCLAIRNSHEGVEHISRRGHLLGTGLPEPAAEDELLPDIRPFQRRGIPALELRRVVVPPIDPMKRRAPDGRRTGHLAIAAEHLIHLQPDLRRIRIGGPFIIDPGDGRHEHIAGIEGLIRLAAARRTEGGEQHGGERESGHAGLDEARGWKVPGGNLSPKRERGGKRAASLDSPKWRLRW